MAVCFIDGNYNIQYKCSYNITNENDVEVDIEYDIGQEIEDKNGIRIEEGKSNFKERDILIIDSDNNKNYLLKNSYFIGYSNYYRSYEAKEIARFKGVLYFYNCNIEQIKMLKKTPKIKKIRIFSKSICDLIGRPSAAYKTNNEEYSVHLLKNHKAQIVEINQNNIAYIGVNDTWTYSSNPKCYQDKIDFSGYIEIKFRRRVNYDELSNYINEIILYMQLYYPNKVEIEKILVEVDDCFFQFNTKIKKVELIDKHVDKTVNEDILIFLKNCYYSIPYRNSRAEIRNIPYIVINKYRSVEDNFLMYYRFIECYCKKLQIEDIKKLFVSYALRNYVKNKTLTAEEIDKYSHEIVSLRNHYVHSGYYLRNCSLKISFEEKEKNYTVNNIDGNWLFERVELLYKACIHIIFSEMLGYKKYLYK